MIEIKPAIVLVDGKSVASYDTVPAALAFRAGIEWTFRNQADRIVNTVLDELRSRAGLENAWDDIDESTQREICIACIHAVTELAK